MLQLVREGDGESETHYTNEQKHRQEQEDLVVTHSCKLQHKHTALRREEARADKHI